MSNKMLKIENIDIYANENILLFNDAASKIDTLKSKGLKVGLCHGGFDLLHPGHIKHFESAKSLCDVLVISVTSDKYVSTRKGDGRPIYTDKLRAYMISCTKYVDYVVISDFKKGVEVIQLLKPSFYIKGPDFINKKTPGINSERDMINKIGEGILYTNDPKLSTSEIIYYIKNKLNNNNILILIDRDGTLIEEKQFLGRSSNWKSEILYNSNITNILSNLQTKYNTTKIVISNQSGVARDYYNCETVEKINNVIDNELNNRGVKIDIWKYCPDVDSEYAEKNKNVMKFNNAYVKEKTKRKPNVDMVTDALKELNKNISNYSNIIVFGDKEEDRKLAYNLNAIFIDANIDDYDEMLIKIENEL